MLCQVNCIIYDHVISILLSCDTCLAATAAIEGKMTRGLKKVLKKIFASDLHEQLAVSDAKLGGVIKEKLNISCIHGGGVAELMRGIRQQMNSLITGLPETEINKMALGLSHRYVIT